MENFEEINPNSTLGLLFKFHRMMEEHFNQPKYDPNKDEELLQLAKERKVSFLIVKKDNVTLYGVKSETIQEVNEPYYDDSVETCKNCGGIISSIGIDRCHCFEESLGA